jgi:sphingoid base N-stearoyltransferase
MSSPRNEIPPLIPNEDHTPTIMEFVNKTWITLNEFVIDRDGKYPTDWEFIRSMLLSIKGRDVLVMLVMSVFITVLRFSLNKWVLKPFADWVKLRPSDKPKFPEAAWKFLVYSVTWSLTLYVVIFSGRHDFFQYPCRIWRFYAFNYDTYFNQTIPSDIYWIYMINFGYYMHNLYGTAFMDVKRKDTAMLLFHHVLTLFLLEFSFLVKFYRIGTLVLLLHDVSDMLMEFTKINIYFKLRNNKKYKLNDYLSSVGFICFAISWWWFRIYWFCVKLLHSTNWCVYIYHKDGNPRLYTFFNFMLICLEMLHIYWFCIIVKLGYKVLTGQMKDGVEDTREFDVIQAQNKKAKSQ